MLNDCGIVSVLESKTIQIAAPVFKCKQDEYIFLQRIAELTGCTKVTSKGAYLQVDLVDTQEQVLAKELQAICTMWHTSFKVMPTA